LSINYLKFLFMNRVKTSLIFITLVLISVCLFAQNIKTNDELTPQVKVQTINKISKILKENYVFPETAIKMENFIKLQLNNKAYDNINDPMQFAEILTADLQSISKDKHLRVRFSPQDAENLLNQRKDGPDPEAEKKFIESMKKENFGFKKVERLGGNIGYVDFRGFAPEKYAKETVASVMAFLANTDAIIFDIRNNGGGSPEGVRLICSYLFGDKPVHLNDLYFRPTDKTEEFWTLRNVDGKKMPDIPVYVLTSSFTFSGAEEFAYNLKNLKRAVIVGETTGGGAHPGGMMPINKSFIMFVPEGRAINPITKTNWEGTGVTPDVMISSLKSLEKAQILALQNLAGKTKDDSRKRSLDWMIESLQAVIDAPGIDENIMKSYAGIYNDRTIFYENGKLYYQRKGRQKLQMTPMSENTFMFKDIDYFRIKFIKDSGGNVTELNGLYDDGTTDKSLRTN
ncbi:MAG TPA: S41 family peptidase, partial [Ignavibacteria bacterium]